MTTAIETMNRTEIRVNRVVLARNDNFRPENRSSFQWFGAQKYATSGFDWRWEIALRPHDFDETKAINTSRCCFFTLFIIASRSQNIFTKWLFFPTRLFQKYFFHFVSLTCFTLLSQFKKAIKIILINKWTSEYILYVTLTVQLIYITRSCKVSMNFVTRNKM